MLKKKTTTQLSFLEWASASHPASFLVPGVWVYPLRRQCLRSKDFTSEASTSSRKLSIALPQHLGPPCPASQLSDPYMTRSIWKSGTIFWWVSRPLPRVCLQLLSREVVSDSFATPWTVACQTTLFMQLFKQEYWSGLPFPSSGDFPDPGIEPRSPALQADSLLSKPPGKPF